MTYDIREVDGLRNRDLLIEFNARDPYFPALQYKHLEQGYWWVAWLGDEPVAFAGMVPFEPFKQVGYFKRCFVLPAHRGHGLQHRLMIARIQKARYLCYTHLVGECRVHNESSAKNFLKAGFEQSNPEQPWATNSRYWVKELR